jgi:RNA polymerase sigma-70 factor (ECF subfamily)
MGNVIQSRTGSRTRAFFQNPTEAGWEAFVDHYGPKVFAWCRSRGLQPSDANDVLQNVLVRLHAAMTKCPWDPKKGPLRRWLKSVTLNALFDYVQKRRIATRAPDWLDAIAESNERFADELAEEEERRVAQTQTQLRVGPKKWQVFYLRVYENRTGDEVAKQLGLALGTVYNYFSEVSRTLTEEMKKLAAASDG